MEEEKGLAWFGFGGHFEKSLVQLPLSIGSNEEWTADGLIRYSQLEDEEEEEEEEASTCE